MKRVYQGLLLGLCFLMFLGAGCPPVSLRKDPVVSSITSSAQGSVLKQGSWQSVGAGIERNSVRFATTTGAEIIIYRFEPKLFEFSFDATTSVKRISEWKDGLPNTVLAMNGVYFHDDDLPSGFLVHRGERIGTRQFDLDKSGLIDVSSGRVKILQLATSTKLTGFKEAAQSYPFLVQDGISSIKTDSGKSARRTFIGLDREGRVYIGILPYAQLSLFELARLLTELPIVWDRVLNMDGGPSTGMAISTGSFSETIDSYVAVPNIMLVRRKEVR